MSDILFGNNNTEVIKRLSIRYFRKNKNRNIAAILAIALTAFCLQLLPRLRLVWVLPSNGPCKCKKAVRQTEHWAI